MHDFFLNACRTCMPKKRVGDTRRSSDRVKWFFTGLQNSVFWLTWVYADFTTVFCAHADLFCLARFVILTCGTSTVDFKNLRREPCWTVIESALPWLESFVPSCGWKNTKWYRSLVMIWTTLGVHSRSQNRPEIPCSNLPALPLM